MSEHSRCIIRSIQDHQFDPEILSTSIDIGIWCCEGSKVEDQNYEKQAMQMIHDIAFIYFQKHKTNFLHLINILKDDNTIEIH